MIRYFFGIHYECQLTIWCSVNHWFSLSAAFQFFKSNVKNYTEPDRTSNVASILGRGKLSFCLVINTESRRNISLFVTNTTGNNHGLLDSSMKLSSTISLIGENSSWMECHWIRISWFIYCWNYSVRSVIFALENITMVVKKGSGS